MHLTVSQFCCRLEELGTLELEGQRDFVLRKLGCFWKIVVNLFHLISTMDVILFGLDFLSILF